MSKRNPGYYTPQRGKNPEKIHRAIEIISKRNGGLGATIKEIREETGIEETKIKREMQWGKKGK